MEIIKIGDQITRIRAGFNGDLVKRTGYIIIIREHIVICNIPDILSRGVIVKFNIETGVCIDGLEFGWLEEIAGVKQPILDTDQEAIE